MFVPDSILAVWVYFEEEGAFVEVEQLGEEGGERVSGEGAGDFVETDDCVLLGEDLALGEVLGDGGELLARVVFHYKNRIIALGSSAALL